MKVYCKKDLITKGDNMFALNFISGQFYDISFEETDKCWVKIGNAWNTSQCFMLKRNERLIELSNNGVYTTHDYSYLFSDYFYTLRDIRKLKIERLNNGESIV